MSRSSSATVPYSVGRLEMAKKKKKAAKKKKKVAKKKKK